MPHGLPTPSDSRIVWLDLHGLTQTMSCDRCQTSIRSAAGQVVSHSCKDGVAEWGVKPPKA